MLGEGGFVLTGTEGLLDPDDDGRERGDRAAAGCCDLWRVADGRIVEHWEACQPVPERLPHDNGFF